MDYFKITHFIFKNFNLILIFKKKKKISFTYPIFPTETCKTATFIKISLEIRHHADNIPNFIFYIS